MDILVLGAGAIGSVFGGFLAKAGHNVSLVGREPHIKAIDEKGLLINGIWGKHVIENLNLSTNIGEISRNRKKQFDIALLSVKSYDTESIIDELKKHIPDSPPVLSLQNGLGNIEKIEAKIGRRKTIGARIIFGVEYIKPAHVKVTVSADRTVIGGLKNGIDESFLKCFANTLTEAGIQTDITDKIYRFIWGKVLYNCALNGLATIIDVNYGKLLLSDQTKEIMDNIIREIFVVTDRKKVPLEWKHSDDFKEVLFQELIPKTFEHHPSMLQDIKRGRKTEIEALNGAVVEIGDELGIKLPYNWSITQLIKALEEKGNKLEG